MPTELIPITRTLVECESIIERGLNTFVEVGNALLEIRDNRLYKESYHTFESYCKERWGFSRIHAHRLIEAAEVATNLLPIGNILPATESQARPLAQLEPELQQEVWHNVIESGDDITASRVQQEVDKILKPHVSYNTGESEWYTPENIIEAARQVMGSIDVDPASSTEANRIVQADIYHTAGNSGLTKTWHGNVFLNPPYSQPLVTQFCELLVDQYSVGEVKQACVLVNNATETQFYQDMLKVCSAVCFIKGRVRFISSNGNQGAPLQGQTVLYFGSNRETFREVFERLGVVLYAKR